MGLERPFEARISHTTKANVKDLNSRVVLLILAVLRDGV